MLKLKSQSSWIYTCFFLLVLISLYFHQDSIRELPNYIHGRAQSDRFALALNYFHNGFDLFKSETYLFNVEFPNNFKVPKENTIVSVDLPIHEYIIAIIMKLIGSKSPFVFRLYMFIYSLIGIWFLLQIGKILKLNRGMLLVVPFIVISSPVFIYYQDNFLPSITSFSNTIIGVFFYLKYIQSKRKRHYAIGLLFLMLAAISRTIYVIPMLTIIGAECLFEIINWYQKRGLMQIKNVVYLSLISIIFLLPILLQYLYNNNYMRYEYGSVFLYYLVPANNLEELLIIIQKSVSRWIFDYLTPFQYGFIFIVFVQILLICRKEKVKWDKISSKLLFITLVSLLGYLLFFIAMATKFPFHDYYFLDTFFIPLLIGLYLFTYLVKVNSKKYSPLIGVALIVFFIPSLIFANANFKDRRKNKSWDYIPETIENFRGVDKIMEELKISTNSKFLVVGPYAPNLPLLMMDRKGYAVMHKSKEDMLNALEWNADYVVLQNNLYLDNFYTHFPDFISYLEKIYDNGRITIAKKRWMPKETSLEEFFNIQKGDLKERIVLDFDTPQSGKWKNLTKQNDSTLSNSSFGLISKKKKFGLSYKTSDIHFLRSTKTKLEVEAELLFKERPRVSKMVVAVKNSEKNIFYKSFDLNSILDSANNNNWQNIKVDMSLPKIQDNSSEFSFYFWNLNEEFYVDNIEISFYSEK